MSSEGKLQVLYRTYEIEEQRALEEKKRIASIVAERQKAVDALVRKRQGLSEALREWRDTGRLKALRSGRIAQAASGSSYAQRVSAEIGALDKDLGERQAELERAEERARLAEEDWIGVRLEKKKLERVLDNRHQIELAVDVAREEVDADELNYFNRDKK